MNISKEKKGDVVTLFVVGSINTQTSEAFETAVKSALGEAKNLIVDLAKTDYISSSGLRVFLEAENLVEGKGSLKVIHLSSGVKEVFDMTGFSSILDLE
jgi:anti-sigma B factor antagonist